jgi:hypothetical protein
VTREASVQFASPILFRVIRVHDWPTYDGWVWLDGYQLDAAGDAVAQRSIFVQIAGLRRIAGANESVRTANAPLRPADAARRRNNAARAPRPHSGRNSTVAAG